MAIWTGPGWCREGEQARDLFGGERVRVLGVNGGVKAPLVGLRQTLLRGAVGRWGVGLQSERGLLEFPEEIGSGVGGGSLVV